MSQNHNSPSAEDFKTIFRNHPAGVTLITATDGTQKVALTATSVASVSASPPTVIFSVSAHSSSAEVLARAKNVVIHFLDVNDLPLAVIGATSGIDRFDQEQQWQEITDGDIAFLNTRAYLRGEVVWRMSAGESTVYAVTAFEIKINRDTDPGQTPDALVHVNRSWNTITPLEQ